MEELAQAVKIPHSVIVRAPGLLPMLYTPRELGDDLGVPPRTVREWIKNNGVPHQRDSRGYIWVNGEEFALWVEAMRKSKQNRSKMAGDEAYCFRCRKPIKLLNPRQKRNGKQILLSGACPECGCKIHRGGRCGES